MVFSFFYFNLYMAFLQYYVINTVGKVKLGRRIIKNNFFVICLVRILYGYKTGRIASITKNNARHTAVKWYFAA